MDGKADVAGKDSRTISSLTEARMKRENMIGLLAWLIVMILATFAGFALGFLSKHWP
jgi:hypothetical protein